MQHTESYVILHRTMMNVFITFLNGFLIFHVLNVLTFLQRFLHQWSRPKNWPFGPSSLCSKITASLRDIAGCRTDCETGYRTAVSFKHRVTKPTDYYYNNIVLWIPCRVTDSRHSEYVANRLTDVILMLHASCGAKSLKMQDRTDRKKCRTKYLWMNR